MTNFLLMIIIGILLYWMYVRGEIDKKEIQQKSYSDLLPDLKGKYCEISWKKMFSGFHHLQAFSMSTKGIIEDFDDEWVVIKIPRKKADTYEIVRKSYISDLKEILDK